MYMNAFKRNGYFLICAAAFLLSCTKNNDTNRCATVTTMAPTTEVSSLRGALDAQGIAAVQDDRGFFYIISREGDTSLRPSVCSNIKVSYTLRSISGTQIEAANNTNLSLSNLIAGWQEGLPLIGKGGYITLYLPPSLAYGAGGSSSIPPNANLIFQIDLVDVL